MTFIGNNDTIEVLARQHKKPLLEVINKVIYMKQFELVLQRGDKLFPASSFFVQVQTCLENFCHEDHFGWR